MEILKTKEETKRENNDPKLYKMLRKLDNKNVLLKLHKIHKKKDKKKESIKAATKPEQQEDEDPWLTKEEKKEYIFVI